MDGLMDGWRYMYIYIQFIYKDNVYVILQNVYTFLSTSIKFKHTVILLALWCQPRILVKYIAIEI